MNEVYELDLYDIYDLEDELEIDEEATEGKYYLSAVLAPSEETDYQPLLDYRIEIPIFFKFDYDLVNIYARSYQDAQYLTPNLEIVKASFYDGKCVAVIKTYWLRVVQRAWRKLYNERQDWIKSVKKNIVSYVSGMTRRQWPSCYGIICRK